MIKARLYTGYTFEAMAMQDNAVLLKDGKNNKCFFVDKKSVKEWYNGNSRMLPKMQAYDIVDTSSLDLISTIGIRQQLMEWGIPERVTTRICKACDYAHIRTLGELFRIGKSNALSLQEFGDLCAKELTKVFKKEFNLEWK